MPTSYRTEPARRPRALRADASESANPRVNVSDAERVASLVAGSALTVFGLRRGGLGGTLTALAGAALALRGATGHSSVFGALHLDTGESRGAAKRLDPAKAIDVTVATTINASAEELFAFWRNFENLPRFMKHLESVQVLDDDRSHWKAKAPLGANVEWDARITQESPNELIAWESLEGSDIPNRGSVRFTPATGGRGTVVAVTLYYDPPGGQIGALIAKLFGEEPEGQVRDDLRRFKAVMETGEIPTTEGQTSGRRER
jgi:uncharacterized membrane protein